jgi:hypothetical protein
MATVLAHVCHQHPLVPHIKQGIWQAAGKAFHSVANPREVGNYNWCQLVVERLKKGIIEHKENNWKFVSGCFLFLTVRATNLSLFLPRHPSLFFVTDLFLIFFADFIP